jgi:hypothetical protein
VAEVARVVLRSPIRYMDGDIHDLQRLPEAAVLIVDWHARFLGIRAQASIPVGQDTLVDVSDAS